MLQKMCIKCEESFLFKSQFFFTENIVNMQVADTIGTVSSFFCELYVSFIRTMFYKYSYFSFY